jgi:hypothetical protein
LNEYLGKTDLIIASNVICHIPDLNNLIETIDLLLTNNGTFIFEEPYLGSMFEKISYDQIYDEHIFMFSGSSIKKIFDLFDLELIDLIKQPTHGGSMRYVVAKKNRYIKTENVKIKSAYKKEQKKTSKLAEDTAYLSEKVATASILKAYNVSAASIRLRGGKKEVFTDKAKKIEQIKICFTLGENLIIPNGKKTVYIRVARPDNKILVKGNEDIYSFTDSNGKKLQYSMKKEVDYQNKSIYMCMYWIKKSTKESAMIGRYNVTVFADGYEIGQTYFELK